MLVTAKQLLVPARRKRYAVPAFNVNDLEFLRAVMDAAVAQKSPVIIQTSEGAVAYAGMDYLVAMARVAAQAPVPVALHLDHGKDLRVIRQAVQSGYTSVMFDGSSLPYAKNVAQTKKVVALAHAKRVSVEAELGAIAGIEDFVTVAERDAHLTDPNQAAAFVRSTRCDALAVAIGTRHGAFKFTGKTHLDIARLQAIAKRVSVPLVLHGASGIREDLKELAQTHGAKLGKARGVLDGDIKKAIQQGVAKVNIDTDLRLAFTAGVREAVDDLPTVIDPRKLLSPASALMREVAIQKMKLFKSAGRA